MPAPKKSRAKKPGRPGDFIFQTQRGPVPLPPLDKFNPLLHANAEWAKIQKQLAEDPDLEKDPEFVADMQIALYAFISSGLPDEYRETFDQRVGVQEIEQMFVDWGADIKAINGVSLGESSG